MRHVPPQNTKTENFSLTSLKFKKSDGISLKKPHRCYHTHTYYCGILTMEWIEAIAITTQIIDMECNGHPNALAQ